MMQLHIRASIRRRIAVGVAPCLAIAFVALFFFGLQTSRAKAGAYDIGLVLDPGGADDHSYNALSIQGLERAESELGVNGTVYPTTGPADFQAAFNQCVADGNALCIGVGFFLYETISNTADLNPGVNFALLDFEWWNVQPNLRGVNFKVQEAGYLAGTLAGRMTDGDMIGAIGGLQIPPVDRFIDGYWYGARCADPAVTTWIEYTNDFGDPDLGDQVARNMISEGADVIHAVAGPTGFGSLLAAAELGKWAIGVDIDQYYQVFNGGTVTGADRMLTSVMKRLDNAVYQTIQDQLAGHFSGGNVWLGLAQDGVGLAPFHEASPSIPISVKNEITATRQAIINGALDVYGPCPSPYEYDFTDYFDHASLTRGTGGLHPLYEWIREDGDLWTFDQTPGSLRIYTQGGGIYGTSNNQRNLLVAPVPPGNFRVTTKVHINPTQNYQHAGLTIYVDDDNYIQINRAYTGGNTLNFDVEIGGVVTNTQMLFADDDVYMSITRYGTLYSIWYSLDNLTWTQFGQVTADFQNPSVALGAANNLVGVDPVNADFAFLRIQGNLPSLDTAFSDAFDSTSLNPSWAWVNPNPAQWSLSANPGYLRISAHPGGISAENLLYRTPPAGMYDVRTRLLFTPTDNYQIAGIPVYLDDDNYLMLGRAYCQTGGGNCVENGIYFDGMQGGVIIKNFATTVHEQGLAHLRLFRAGSHYFGFYSADGAHWRYIGRHNFTPTGSGLKLGLATGQDTAGALIPADFDNFLLKTVMEELHLPLVVRQLQSP